MPTTFFTDRRPYADARSLVIYSQPVLRRRLLAYMLIATLAFPFFLATNEPKTGAALRGPGPVSAPPEAFTIHRAEIGGVAGVFADAINSFRDLFASSTIPIGFENAKTPTITERYLKRVLVLITASKSAIGNPESEMVTPSPSGTVLFDFDGDGKADIGRWNSGNTEFKVRDSGDDSYTIHTIGSSSAVPAAGDFDGDGKTDAAVFNAGSWTIKKSSNGSALNISWGASEDKPVAADYDGDGITDAAVFRPSTNTWWVLKSSDSSYTSTTHGSSGDIPVTGNWDGDAYADLAVFRPSTGYWYVQRTTAGLLSVAWGMSTDVAVPADFDGDDKTDIAVYRPSTGAWWVMESSTGFDGSHFAYTWGNYGDQPVPADYDEDGKADFAVWRPKTGVWYISKSSEDNEEYEYYGLGIAGDTAVPSAYLKQVATTVYGDDMALARLSPKNATGGTNLYSRNFSWGTRLVGLPGRAGLDAGFGIGYNSLVWTKLGSEMHFDVDQSNVSPGFRLGYSTIEATYYDDGDKDAWAFMMVSPSGSRIEFRQTVVSGVYETADSRYTQLKLDTGQSINTPIEEIGITIITTGGTMMSYEWLGGAYRCSQIKDRNGNYITIDHDEYGALRTVTDTLGRVITVNYDGELYPTSITQTWKDNNGAGSNVTHAWATFSYANTGDNSTNYPAVDTNFSGLTIVGPPDSSVIKVLKEISFSDGSYTHFSYNSYVQVTKVENFADDDHLLNQVRTNLDSVSGAQSDCPRFTATYTKVDNFNLNGSGVPQEVEVTNSLTTSSSYSLPGNLTGDAAKIEVAMTGHPDGLYSRVYAGESGWKEGLPIATEDCIGTNCADRKRWTWTDWTQDNSHPTNPSTLPYILNPRVVESRVGDGTNTKKTSVSYWLNEGTNIAIFGLVMSTFAYGTDLSTVLKASHTTYDMASAYTSQRIIGLPSTVMFYGGPIETSNLLSKVTYEYDEGNFSDSGLQQNITAVQHDGTGYGSSFITGRGNLTATTRWNVEYPTSSGYAVSSSVKYNTAGSVVSQTDPIGRVVKIGYTDSFNSTVGVSTYAYPTTLTDAGSNSSTVTYRYDVGASVEANSPTPYGASYGKKTKRLYDSVGRLERDSVYLYTTEYSYVRYEFPGNGVQAKMYATIADVDGDGDLAEDEMYSERWSDGAGRAIASRTEHPGSTGGWSATRAEYDILGRLKKESVPAEVSISGSTWTLAGDDSTWLWNAREFDWKGRVTRTIPSDSNGTDGKDTLVEYTGCGCAGGQITTIKGPVTTAIDVAGTSQTTKRRVQKIHQDILSRTFKTEIWDLDGAGDAPYLTTMVTFNGRDQVTLSRQYAGGTSSSTYQNTTSTFDGHGRLLTRHNPIEDSNTNTSWTYNGDDTVATMTDPRGAVVSYSYGNPSVDEKRAVVTGITYTGGTNIPDPGDVVFEYDNVGNRTLMKDGVYGTDPFNQLTYQYDFLSRLTSEAKEFAHAPEEQPENGYRLEYTYHLGGGIKSIEGPFGEVATYNVDEVGRTTGIGASGFTGLVSSFASGITYRAFGAVKGMTYTTTDQTNLSVTYDLGQRPVTFEAASSANTIDVQNKAYTYHNDGTIKEVDNNVDANFTQTYVTDFASRLKTNQVKNPTEPTGPYTQTLGYDAFSNITSRATSADGTVRSFTAAYTNHRKTSGGYGTIGSDSFDAAGNVVENNASSTDYRRWKFDAAGRMTDWFETSLYAGYTRFDQEETLTVDGDGRVSKRTKRSRMYASPPQNWSETANYYLYSSVTGQLITELDNEGDRAKTNVYMGNTVIADDQNSWGVRFKTVDPITKGVIQSELSGEISPFGIGRVEFDALGSIVPHQEPEVQEPHMYLTGGHIGNPETGCVDPDFGEPMPCNVLASLMGHLGTIEKRLRELYPQNYPSYPKRDRVSPDNRVFADDRQNVTPGVKRAYDPYAPDGVSLWDVAFPYEDRPLADPALDKLRSNLEVMMADTLCGNFINQVMKNLLDKITVVVPGDDLEYEKFAGGLLDNFDRIRKNYGFWSTDNLLPDTPGNFDLRGISFNSRTYSGDTDVTVKRPFSKGFKHPTINITKNLSTTFTLVHELTHAMYVRAGGGVYPTTHPAMALAAQAALVRAGVVSQVIDIPDDTDSDYFNQALALACGHVNL